MDQDQRGARAKGLDGPGEDAADIVCLYAGLTRQALLAFPGGQSGDAPDTRLRYS
jgi:hypothetical protein